jgi:hypothetical protein
MDRTAILLCNSWTQDKQKMTIVEPALYSHRFQAYISRILI